MKRKRERKKKNETRKRRLKNRSVMRGKRDVKKGEERVTREVGIERNSEIRRERKTRTNG